MPKTEQNQRRWSQGEGVMKAGRSQQGSLSSTRTKALPGYLCRWTRYFRARTPDSKENSDRPRNLLSRRWSAVYTMEPANWVSIRVYTYYALYYISGNRETEAVIEQETHMIMFVLVRLSVDKIITRLSSKLFLWPSVVMARHGMRYIVLKTSQCHVLTHGRGSVRHCTVDGLCVWDRLESEENQADSSTAQRSGWKTSSGMKGSPFENQSI